MNLIKFIATQDDPREWLHQPFKINNFTVYCNGHIFAAIDNGEKAAELDKEAAKKSIAKWIDSCKNETTWQSMPVVKKSDFPCKQCRGLICHICDGTGFSSGIQRDEKYANLNGISVNPFYLTCFTNNFKSCMVSTKGKDELILIKFDGGYGGLMPLKTYDSRGSVELLTTPTSMQE